MSLGTFGSWENWCCTYCKANELKETLISGKERWEKQKNEIRSGYHQNVCVKQRPSNGKVCRMRMFVRKSP